MEIDTQNKHLVGVRGGNILMMVTPPRGAEMSKADALLLAAWIVALAEDNEGEFQAVLDAVQGFKPA